MRPGAILLILCIILVSASGCRLTRHEGSRFIAPPLDVEREAAHRAMEAQLADPAVMLAESDDYYIGPGDVVSFTLVGRTDIFGTREETGGKYTVTVTQNPLVVLPLIGAIRVHGKTADQLRDDLEAAYAPFVVKPIPVVTIEHFHQNQVSVLGSVRTPGRYPLEFGDTLLDAVFKAGGLNMGRETPPARYLKVYREKLNQRERSELSLEELLERVVEDGHISPREEIVIPIGELILGGNIAYNIPLMPNDIVYIPPAGTVMIQGRVRHPGVVFLGPSLRTVTQVITERGGLRYGAASTIEIVRSFPDGRQVSYFLHARQMLRRQSEDFLLQDNDQVFVFTHPVRSTLEWLGNVFRATAATGVNATYNPL